MRKTHMTPNPAADPIVQVHEAKIAELDVEAAAIARKAEARQRELQKQKADTVQALEDAKRHEEAEQLGESGPRLAAEIEAVGAKACAAYLVIQETIPQLIALQSKLNHAQGRLFALQHAGIRVRAIPQYPRLGGLSKQVVAYLDAARALR